MNKNKRDEFIISVIVAAFGGALYSWIMHCSAQNTLQLCFGKPPATRASEVIQPTVGKWQAQVLYFETDAPLILDGRWHALPQNIRPAEGKFSQLTGQAFQQTLEPKETGAPKMVATLYNDPTGTRHGLKLTPGN